MPIYIQNRQVLTCKGESMKKALTDEHGNYDRRKLERNLRKIKKYVTPKGKLK